MRELRTEIDIAATAERIWSALMDFENYPKWNPFVREIAGDTRPGSSLSVFIKPEGGMGMKLAPVVVTSVENSMFAWKGKLGVSGIFDGQHEFILEPNGDGWVRFVQREEFSGFLVPVLWPMLERKTRRGFEEMNAALKALVEGN
jgi:hypothetical protein